MTYNSLIHAISINLAIAPVQNFGCFVNLALTHEPPRRFWDEGEDESNYANHSPLITGTYQYNAQREPD